MAKKDTGVGAEVRKAMDGPKVEHDALLDRIEIQVAKQFERSSDASGSGEELKEFIEATGLNTTAYKFAENLFKTSKKKDGQTKAMDVIRSIKLLVPMMESHIGGQPDMLDKAAAELEADPKPAEKPKSKRKPKPKLAQDEVADPVTTADVAALTGGDEGGDYDTDLPEGGSDDIEDDGQFDGAVAALDGEGDETNVVQAFPG